MSNIPLLLISPGGSFVKAVVDKPFDKAKAKPIQAGADHVLAVNDHDGENVENALRCLETEDDDYTTPFYESCWRVLCKNTPRGKGDAVRRIWMRRSRHSILGVFGHIERFNAWTHLVGAFGFLAYSIVRPWAGFDTQSTSGQLASYSTAITSGVFFVSTAYHTLGTTRWFAAIARMFDHAAIDVALGVANLCDLSIATNGFEKVYWTSIADSIAIAMTIVAFFSYRRWVLPSTATETGWGSCKLGLFRMQHTDLEHGALRSAGYVCIAFLFISILPLIAEKPGGTTLIYCNIASVGLLILGLYIDNVWMVPDRWYQSGNRNLYFANKGCGCIINSHGIWHVLCLVACILQTIGREVVIQEQRVAA